MEFSSQVAQYWSVAALRQHVDNAFAVLADDGTLVVSGIPWSRMRRAYAWSDLTDGPRRSAPVAGLNYLHNLVRGTMGRWYDYPLIRSIAESRQLQVRFFGSLHYPYRFHAVLRRRADRRASYCS